VEVKLESKDGSAERRVLIQCITNTHFLTRVAGRLGKDPFRSKDSNILYSWCEEHVFKYKTAPHKNILELWQEYEGDPDAKRRIERLLKSLNGEYKKDNKDVDFSLDLAERFFNTVKLERHKELIDKDMLKGKIDDAIGTAMSFPKISLKPARFIDLLGDRKINREAFSTRHKALIKYPGAAGEFFGDELAPDSFVAFMGASKARKSYVLLDLCWNALKQKRKIAYFQVGDLSRNQVIRRFQRRAMYRPFDAKLVKYPTVIVAPTDYRGLAQVEFEMKEYEKDATQKQAEDAMARAKEKYKPGDIRLSYHPIRTVNVSDIRTTLRDWDDEGYVSEVVVIDYAGNLAPVNYNADPVTQVSDTWALMRQLSEERGCLVLTAQQSNKEGFDKWVLTRRHFSESKMILAHVTAFVGINQTNEEQSLGVTRFNFVVRREGEFRETDCLYLATCLDRADMCVKSALMPKEV
jgi:hypothetical protein